MKSELHLVDNRAGFRLAVSRFAPEGTPRGYPVLVVPGYGMNSFIFGFHPKGPSLVESLVARGLEVWTVDLRGQGRSIRESGRNRYGLADLAVDDVGSAIRHVLARTKTGAKEVDLVGCSLGAALTFAHVACVPSAPVHAIVSMAGLVTWKELHPLVKLAFGSARLAGLVRITNTRRFARIALPVLVKVAPSLLSIYLNHESTDLSQSARLVQTVEDPHPVINREIAEWIRRGDLVVRGVNVSEALPSMRYPFMCVVAAHDGIVMPATARHAYDVIGSTEKELLVVGDDELKIAHGDLFLCHGAQERVFTPIADFLAKHAPSPQPGRSSS
jgi:alpha-beta hydrolase superfamily lysophospholipase